MVQGLRAQLTEALALTGTSVRDVWKPYWAVQQRFFKLLCISLKVNVVVKGFAHWLTLTRV